MSVWSPSERWSLTCRASPTVWGCCCCVGGRWAAVIVRKLAMLIKGSTEMITHKINVSSLCSSARFSSPCLWALRQPAAGQARHDEEDWQLPASPWWGEESGCGLCQRQGQKQRVYSKQDLYSFHNVTIPPPQHQARDARVCPFGPELQGSCSGVWVWGDKHVQYMQVIWKQQEVILFVPLTHSAHAAAD